MLGEILVFKKLIVRIYGIKWLSARFDYIIVWDLRIYFLEFLVFEKGEDVMRMGVYRGLDVYLRFIVSRIILGFLYVRGRYGFNLILIDG